MERDGRRAPAQRRPVIDSILDDEFVVTYETAPGETGDEMASPRSSIPRASSMLDEFRRQGIGNTAIVWSRCTDPLGQGRTTEMTLRNRLYVLRDASEGVSAEHACRPP